MATREGVCRQLSQVVMSTVRCSWQGCQAGLRGVRWHEDICSWRGCQVGSRGARWQEEWQGARRRQEVVAT